MTSFAVVGTGFIADVMARAISASEHGQLTAVVSRSKERAEEFAKAHRCRALPWDALLATNDIDAVYLATPTSTKEDLAVPAAHAGKHVLIDKPFACKESVQRIANACNEANVFFMDATHFVHHPRTKALRSELAGDMGPSLRLRTGFFFSFQDPTNIRYDTSLEPQGALGDLAWYNMRAVVEFLTEDEPVASHSVLRRHAGTEAITSGTGILEFPDGKVASWDIGYDTGATAMDLDIFGTGGLLRLDDFVLDWHSSFAYQRERPTGYWRKPGTIPGDDVPFIDTPCEQPAHIAMIDAFCALARTPEEREPWVRKALATQSLLDRILTGN